MAFFKSYKEIGNKNSGVIITAASENDIKARIVRGKARPALPCVMFGGLFAQGPEDAIMMRPYVDELNDELYENVLDGIFKAAEYDEDEVSDSDDEEDLKVKETLKKEAKELMSTVIMNDKGIIRNLLTNTNRDCLIEKDTNVGSIDFETLCEEGYILFDFEDINWERAKDCFIILSKEESPNYFGTSDTDYQFNIICKMGINDLAGYKTRALELCSNLSDMLNGYEISDDEKLFYMMYDSVILSEEYYSTSIYFTNNSNYSSNEGQNVFVDYDKDSEAIFKHLLDNKEIKEYIVDTNKSVKEAYELSYLQLSENFADIDEKGCKACLILIWDFSFDTSINIVPVVRNKQELKPLIFAIRKRLSNFELPVRGVINYADGYTQERIELSDKLVTAILVFKCQ